MKSILFVCLGNICRSPAAEEIMRLLVKDEKEFRVASCGLGSWHIGQLPDSRMQEFALRRGIILSSRAQQFRTEFLEEYDYILAADQEVLLQLEWHAENSNQKEKLHLMTAFSDVYWNREIPDPYREGDLGFELVLDMLQNSCEGLLTYIKKIDE